MSVPVLKHKGSEPKFLSDNLVGVLSSDIDEKKARAERIEKLLEDPEDPHDARKDAKKCSKK